MGSSTPHQHVTLDSRLTGVLGGRTAAALDRAFGMMTVADLLAHYPRRYAKRGEVTALDSVPFDENVTIIADVVRVQERSMRSRRGGILEVTISDGQGRLLLTFFNQSWRARELVPGVRGIFAGKVTVYRGALQLSHPDYELFDTERPGASGIDTVARTWAQTPIPIYPSTGNLASWQIHKSISVTLDVLGHIMDPVPEWVVREQHLLSFREALEAIHRPESDAQARHGQETLRFHEAFVLQVALLQQRLAPSHIPAISRRPASGGYLDRFDAALSFTLTSDQLAVGDEIAKDLGSEQAMQRLVQGEVGSGKTLVALRAMLAVADSGGQSVLLAPTEVLAGQHSRSLTRVLGPELSAELMPTLLTGQLSTGERKRALLNIVSGRSRIVVGTHALLNDAVTFFDLGLVVIDEQHRFGVDQRETLRAKGTAAVHTLVLTATPIPRTVAMTIFGDLDVSTITEVPPGRKGIETFGVFLHDHPGWESRVWERSAEEIAQGRQVFIVCPAISVTETEERDETSDEEQESVPRPRATVEGVFAQLRSDPLFAEARIAILHGALSSQEKDETMRAFAAGEIDLVVATTVIEVGVDVPNASTMVVLDAERFGVAQLHQLRGRVGRGEYPGLCLLVTSAEPGTLGYRRVEAVAQTNDGFELASLDLELRREGDVLGRKQSGGGSSLRLLQVTKHEEVIVQAREAAQRTLSEPGGVEKYPALGEALARRLSDVERRFMTSS